MKKLGYYAKDKDNNLYQFRWQSDNAFEIFTDGRWLVKDPKEFEILEIGYFTNETTTA